MKHYQLRALVAVADQGSIRGASRALFLSQPAVTKAIRELENELGILLLERQSNGAVLTAEGKILLERAKMIVREFERAEHEMNMLKGRNDGKIVVGVTPLAGLTIMPHAFVAFREAWPEVELSFQEYTAGQIYNDLKNGTLDFAVGTLPHGGTEYPGRHTELISLPTSFAVRKSSPLAGCTRLIELQEAEWLHTDTSGQFVRFLTNLFAQRGLERPRRITRCASQSLFYSLSLHADVVIFWSQHSLGFPVLNEQFQSLQLNEILPELKLSLMLREESLLTRSAEYFIRCVREVAAREAEILSRKFSDMLSVSRTNQRENGRHP